MNTSADVRYTEYGREHICKKKPTGMPVPGNKVIDEYIGRLNSNTDDDSVGKMIAPVGRGEPRQIPNFDENTIVISGKMRVETDNDVIEQNLNHPFLAHKNHSNSIGSSNPYDEHAEYLAVCIPAFSNETVNRDKDEL